MNIYIFAFGLRLGLILLRFAYVGVIIYITLCIWVELVLRFGHIAMQSVIENHPNARG